MPLHQSHPEEYAFYGFVAGATRCGFAPLSGDTKTSLRLQQHVLGKEADIWDCSLTNISTSTWFTGIMVTAGHLANAPMTTTTKMLEIRSYAEAP